LHKFSRAYNQELKGQAAENGKSQLNSKNSENEIKTKSPKMSKMF
jgi:hypothetical protein